jgi:hypothetical protein
MRARFLVATLAALLGSAACGIPLGAIRRSPPAGLDARIAATGAHATDFTLEGTTGTFRLGDILANEHVLLVFYRGHW